MFSFDRPVDHPGGENSVARGLRKAPVCLSVAILLYSPTQRGALASFEEPMLHRMDSALVGEHRGRVAQCQRDHPSESEEREGGRRWPHLVNAFFPPTDVLEAVILNGRSLLVVALAGDEVFDHLIVRRRAPRPAPNCCKHLRAAVLSVCCLQHGCHRASQIRRATTGHRR